MDGGILSFVGFNVIEMTISQVALKMNIAI